MSFFNLRRPLKKPNLKCKQSGVRISDMMLPKTVRCVALFLFVLISLTACELGSEPEAITPDEQIKAQVESVISRAADLPQQINVEVRAGIVFVSGSLTCEDCGGLRTPGNIGTVQQSLGAMVRAVTGVNAVVFELDSET